ncbi:MAG: hypothetical protein EOO43_05865 [Flavobacterium sp.]|nr:MAG: hypothetical protein EOO43_05865 [Flavobacterium sp.]
MQEVEYNKIKYKKIEVLPTQDIIDMQRMQSISSAFRDDGSCLASAYEVAKLFDSVCVEGFVICTSRGSITVIRHAWNKINGKSFDVSKDLVWADYKKKDAVFMYYPIDSFDHKKYNPEEGSEFDISFLSDAINIAKGIKREIFMSFHTRHGSQKYSADEINVGDEVYFESTASQSNHDDYWLVTGKKSNRIFISFNKMGMDETWTLEDKEILYVLPLGEVV